LRLFPVVVAALLGSPAALAQSRAASLDHSGSLGLLVAAGTEFATTEIADCLTCQPERTLAEFGALLDLGATAAVGSEGNELTLRLRLNRLTAASGESIFFGYRSYFGRDELKTFAAFDLAAVLRPIAAGGARVAFGVAWDFSPLFGVWAEAGANFALGEGRRFGVELGLGLQARSYLLE
jgi:hypothetical protein